MFRAYVHYLFVPSNRNSLCKPSGNVFTWAQYYMNSFVSVWDVLACWDVPLNLRRTTLVYPTPFLHCLRIGQTTPSSSSPIYVPSYAVWFIVLGGTSFGGEYFPNFYLNTPGCSTRPLENMPGRKRWKYLSYFVFRLHLYVHASFHLTFSSITWR